MEANIQIERFKQRLRHFYFYMKHILQKLIDRKRTKIDKVKILSLKWDKILANLMEKSKKMRDSKMISFCYEAITINPKIKEAVLKQYLKNCY